MFLFITVNLANLKTFLKNRLGIECGSDHTLGYEVSLDSFLGAHIIEKHVTLNKYLAQIKKLLYQLNLKIWFIIRNIDKALGEIRKLYLEKIKL